MKWPEQLQFIPNGKMKQKTSDLNMDGYTCVISGATSGVGKATLIKFAEAHANLVMVVRNQEKANPIKDMIENTYHVKVDIVIADFSDFDSVRQAATYINNNYEKIDILVNSVGIHSTKKHLSKHHIELVYTTNHLSIFLFTMLLIDKLKESQPSRIIQVNSEGHRFYSTKLNDLNFKKHIYTGLRSYGASKTAQLYTVYELAKQLKDSGVTIIAMHPGAVKTNIGQNNGFLYRLSSKLFTSMLLKDVHISSDAIHYLATSPEVLEHSGEFYNLTILEIPAKHARDKNKQELIWKSSLELTGLNLNAKKEESHV